MANRYWRGGTGTWSTTSTTNWSTTSGGPGGASVPTAADAVIFDQAATYTVTLTGALNCLSLTISNGTVTTTSTGSITCAGNLTLIAGTVWNGTGTLQFTNTCTITTNGTVIKGLIQLNRAFGVYTLGSSLTQLNTNTLALIQGTLQLNGFDVFTGAFSSSNSNSRVVDFGSNYIYVRHSTAGTTCINISTATNWQTLNTGGGFRSDAAVTRTFDLGSTAFANFITGLADLTFDGTGTAAITFNGNSVWGNLNFGTIASTVTNTTSSLRIQRALTLSATGTYTGMSVSIGNPGFTHNFNGKRVNALTFSTGAGTSTLGSSAAFTTMSQTSTDAIIDCGGFSLVGTGQFTLTKNSNANIINFTELGTTGIFDITGYSFVPNAGVIIRAGTLNLFVGADIDLSNGGDLLVTGTIATNSAGSEVIIATGAGTVTAAAITQNLGTVTINKNLTLTGDYTHVGGSLIIGDGITLTVAKYIGTGTTTRSIAFGNITAGNMVLAGTVAAQNAVNVTNATGWTKTGLGGFISNADVTRTYIFGTTGGSYIKAPSITLTGTGAGQQTFTSNSYFDKIDFGSTTMLVSASTININALTLSSGGTFSNLNVTFLGTGTVITNGKSVGAFRVDSFAGNSTTLADALGCTTFTLSAGILDLAGYNLTCSSTATYFDGTLNNFSSTITCTTFNVSGSSIFNFTSGTINPSAGVTINSGAGTGGFTLGVSATLGAVSAFQITNGITTLNKAYALTATGDFTFLAGTLTLGGDLTTGAFTSNATNVRSIAFSTYNIILAHTTAAQTVLNMNTATNFTWTGTGGFVSDASVTRTYTFGTSAASGTSANSPNLSLTGSGTAVQTFTTGSWFNNLNFGSTAFNPGTTSLNLDGLTLSSGGTYTTLTVTMVGTGTITSNGKTIAALTITAGTTTLGDTLTTITTATTTLTSGTLNLNGFDLTTGIFASGGSVTRSITFGANNIILAHTTAAQTVLNMATASNFTCTGTGGFTSDASVTRTYVFGTTGGTSANSPNLSLTGSGTAVQTFTTGSWFGILNFGSTAFNPGTTSLNLDGLTLSSGGTFSGLTATMVGTGTITSNNNATLGVLTITAGNTTLGDTLTTIDTSTTTLTSGTLNLNGFNLTTGIFNSLNTNTRVITFGSNNIYLVHPTAAQIVLIITNNNLSWTGTGGFSTAMSVTRTFQAGGTPNTVSAGVNLFFTSGSAEILFTGGDWYSILDFTGNTSNATIISSSVNVTTFVLASGGTYTSLSFTTYKAGTLTSNGKPIFRLTIGNTAYSIQLTSTTLIGDLTLNGNNTTTLSIGTLVLNGYTLFTGIFSSSSTQTRSIVFGTSNIVLAQTSVSVGSTVLSMATATNFTYTGTGGFTSDASVTRTYTFGTTGGSTTNAPNLSLTGSGTAVQTFTTGSWFKNLNFGTTAFAVPATVLSIGGDLTLSSGGTFTGLTAIMVASGTITSNGQSLAGLTVNTTGTATLADALTASGALTLTQGTLACSTFSVTSATFASTGTLTRSMSGSGTYTITGAGTAFSNASAAGITITGLIISMTAATAKTFAGGSGGSGGSFSTLNQGGAGALTISGNFNSFDDLTATTRPSTITFTSGQTRLFTNFTLSGTPGNLVTINSTVNGSQHILSKSSGTVDVGFLSIQDSNATGGATWYAGATSTNVSNNLGWIFTAPPGLGTSGMFLMFN